MKRRKFLSSAVVGGLGASLGPALPGSGPAAPEAPISPQARTFLPFNIDPNRQVTQIGRWTLEELRDFFRRDLFEKRMPLWGKYGIDRQFGGFFTRWKKDGTYPSTDKRIELQGRVLWLFSRFFKDFAGGRVYFEAARQGEVALVRHGLDDLGRWQGLLTRDWKVKGSGPDAEASISMALGLAEYAAAGRDDTALRLAEEAAFFATEMVLAPQFRPYASSDALEPGTKSLGTWVRLLGSLLTLAERTKRGNLESLARMCVRFILQYHWQRGRGYALSYLRPDFTPFPDDALAYEGRSVSGREGVQAAWLVMAEAIREGNRQVFLDAMELGFRTLETCWENGPEPGPADYENIDARKKAGGIGSPSAAGLADTLVFSLAALEHTHASSAALWFDKVFGYLWNRPGIWDPADEFDEPRAVMSSLQALDRMIARKGHVSPFFFAP